MTQSSQPGAMELAAKPARTAILLRLVISVVLLIALEIIVMLVQVIVLFQYILLMITRSRSEPLRNFSNKISLYGYKLLRYMTLNDNIRPFPFSDFPATPENPCKNVEFP